MNVYLIVFWKVNVINCCKEVDLQLRRCNKMKPIFVFNINTVDNPESAKEGAKLEPQEFKIEPIVPETEIESVVPKFQKGAKFQP